MEKYLRSRIKKEFKDIKNDFGKLFSKTKWLQNWTNKGDHNKLYSLYVKLQILCILLRICLKYKMIDNISLPTISGKKSLNDFCNYIIHRLSGCYYDNRQFKNFLRTDLKIYLKIDTDRKKEVSFVISDIIPLIGKEIQKSFQRLKKGT